MRIDSQKGLTRWASLRNINVTIDQKIILSNINVDLNHGENILLLGWNGLRA